MIKICNRLNIVYLFVSVLLLSACTQKEPQRIVSLAPSHTEILYALDLDDEVVGMTRYCNYPPIVNRDKKERNIKIVGGFIDIDLDSVIDLKPTLVLGAYGVQKKFADELRKQNINALNFEPETLEDVFNMIEQIGAATGESHRANILTGNYRRSIKRIKRQTEILKKVTVYFEINHNGPYALSGKSPINDIIELAGGKNIFADITENGFVPTHEEIIKRNPDVILTPLWPGAGEEEVTTIREIVMRKGYENINAVKNSRVIHYDSSLFKRPGTRQVKAIRKLAYLLHPYHFDNPRDSVDPWELGKIDETYKPAKQLK